MGVLARLATTLLAKGWLAEEPYHAGISGLFATRAATELFAEADCVIGIGASLSPYTTEHGYLYPNARFVHLDNRPHVIMGDGRGADCYVQGDARVSVESLERLLAERGVQSTGYHTPQTTQALAQPIDPRQFDVQPGLVDPREAVTCLDECLPPETGVVIGGGHFISFPYMHMRKPRPTFLSTIHFGCIGQGVGTAIGAVVARGNQPTVLVDGDASTLMHVVEIETAARYRLPLLAVVLNDEALGAEYHKLRAHGLEQDLARITTPDLGAVARAFGGRGAQARSVAELQGAVKEFLAEPGPMIVDVRVSREVVSVPYRRVHFGAEE